MAAPTVSSVTLKKPSRRIGDLLTDAQGRTLSSRAAEFTPKGQAVLALELPAHYDDARARAALDIVAKNIDRLSVRTFRTTQLGAATQQLAGPQSAPDPLLDRPAIERAVVHFASGMASATPQFVQEGGQRIANWLYEKQTGQKIDTNQRPIQRTTAALVGPARGPVEKGAEITGSMATAFSEIGLMRRLPFLRSVPGGGMMANAARGGATMAAYNAMAPHENMKERAISTGVGAVLGGATEVIPIAVMQQYLRNATNAAAGPVRAEAQQALNAITSASTPEEQAAAQQFAASVVEKMPAVYKVAADAMPGAQRAAGIASHVGSAAAFGPLSAYSEYWLNKAAGNDVELPDWRDVAVNTAALLGAGVAGDAVGAWRGRTRGAPEAGNAAARPSLPGPKGPEAGGPKDAPEGGIGVFSEPISGKPATTMQWTFPHPNSADGKARPGFASQREFASQANANIKKLGNDRNPMFGGRTPQESFNYHFNQAVQEFAQARGVQPEHLGADDVKHAIARAIKRTKGELLVHRTMTLPPIPATDPQVAHKLSWRKKATEHANTLLGGKLVEVDMPDPSNSTRTVTGRATVLRVEMDPSMKKEGVRLLVQDEHGRLVPLAFDTAADLTRTLRVVPDAAPGAGGEPGRLTTSRIVRTGRPPLTEEGRALAEAATSGRTVPQTPQPALLPERSASSLEGEALARAGADFAERAKGMSEAFRLPGKAETVARRGTAALLREMEQHGVKITRAEIAVMRAEARVGAGQIPEFDRENWVAKRFASALARRITERFGERAQGSVRGKTAPVSRGAIQLPAGSPPPAAPPATTPAPEGVQPAATTPTTAEPAAPATPSAAPEKKRAPEWLIERRRQEGYPPDAIHTPFEAERDADVIRTDPDLIAIDKADPEAKVMQRALEGRLGFAEFKERMAKLRAAAPETPAPKSPETFEEWKAEYEKQDAMARDKSLSGKDRLAATSAAARARVRAFDLQMPERGTYGFLNSEGSRLYVFSPSTTIKDGWRVTTVDEHGPSGHMEFGSKEEAIRVSAPGLRFERAPDSLVEDWLGRTPPAPAAPAGEPDAPTLPQSIEDRIDEIVERRQAAFDAGDMDDGEQPTTREEALVEIAQDSELLEPAERTALNRYLAHIGVLKEVTAEEKANTITAGRGGKPIKIDGKEYRFDSWEPLTGKQEPGDDAPGATPAVVPPTPPTPAPAAPPAPAPAPPAPPAPPAIGGSEGPPAPPKMLENGRVVFYRRVPSGNGWAKTVGSIMDENLPGRQIRVRVPDYGYFVIDDPRPIGGVKPAKPAASSTMASTLEKALKGFEPSMNEKQRADAIASHERRVAEHAGLQRELDEIMRKQRRYKYGSENYRNAKETIRNLMGRISELEKPLVESHRHAEAIRHTGRLVNESLSPMSRIISAMELGRLTQEEANGAAKSEARAKIEAAGVPAEMVDALVEDTWRAVYRQDMGTDGPPTEFANTAISRHFKGIAEKIISENRLYSGKFDLRVNVGGSVADAIESGKAMVERIREHVAERAEKKEAAAKSEAEAAAARERRERGQEGVLPAEAFAPHKPFNEPARPQIGYWSPPLKGLNRSVWTDGHMMVFRDMLLKPTMAKDFAPDWPGKSDGEYPAAEQVIPTDANTPVIPRGVIRIPRNHTEDEISQIVMASDDWKHVTALKPEYYNMLRKYLGNDITFEQAEGKPLSALVVKRGGKLAGLIMPVRMARADVDIDAIEKQVGAYKDVPKGATPSFYQLDPALIPSFTSGGHLEAPHGNALGKMVEKYPDIVTPEAQRDILAFVAKNALKAGEVGWLTKQWIDDLGGEAYSREAIAAGVEAALPREWSRALGDVALHEAQTLEQANAVLGPLVEAINSGKKKKEVGEAFERAINAAQRGVALDTSKVPDAQRAVVQDVWDKLKKVADAAEEARSGYRKAVGEAAETGESVSSKLTAIAKKVNETLGQWARQAPMGGGFGALDPVLGWFVNRSREFVRNAEATAARRAGRKARTVSVKEGGKVLRKDIMPLDPASEDGLYRMAATSKGAVMGDFIVMPPELRGPFMQMRAELDGGRNEFDEELFHALGPDFIKEVKQYYPHAVLAMKAMESLEEPDRASREWPEWDKRRNEPGVAELLEKWRPSLVAARAHLDNLLGIVNEAHAVAGLKPVKRRANYITHLLDGTAEWKSESLVDFFHNRKLDPEERREINKRFADHRQGDDGYVHDFWVAMLAYNNWAAAYSARVKFLARAKEWLSTENARYDIQRATAVREAVTRWCFPNESKFSQDMNDSVRLRTFAQLGGGVSPIGTIEEAAALSGVPKEQIERMQVEGQPELRFAYVRPGSTVNFTQPDKWAPLGKTTPNGAQVYVGLDGHAYGLGNAKLTPFLERVADEQLRLKVKLRRLAGRKVTTEDSIAAYLEQRNRINRTAAKPGTALVSFFSRALAQSMVGLSVATTAVNMTGLLTHVYTYYGLRHMLGGLRRYGPVAKRQVIRAAAEYLRHHQRLSVPVYNRMMRAAHYTPDELMMDAGKLNQGFAQELDQYLERLEAGQHAIDVQIARVATNWMMGAETVIRGISVMAAIDKALANGHGTDIVEQEVAATLENRNAMIRALRGELADHTSVISSVVFDEYFTNFYYDRAGQFSAMSDAWYKTLIGLFSTFPNSTLVHREIGPTRALGRTAGAALTALRGGEGKPKVMRGTSGNAVYDAPRYGADEPYGPPGGMAGWLRKGGATYWDREWSKRYMRQMLVTGILGGATALLGANFMLGYSPYMALAIIGLLSIIYPDSEGLERVRRSAESGVVFRAQRGLMAGGPLAGMAVKKIQGEDWGQVLGGGADFAHDIGIRLLTRMAYRPLKGVLELNPEFFDTDELRWTYDFMNVKSAYYGMPAELKAQHILAVPDVAPDILEQYRMPIHDPEKEGSGSLRRRERPSMGGGRR